MGCAVGGSDLATDSVCATASGRRHPPGLLIGLWRNRGARLRRDGGQGNGPTTGPPAARHSGRPAGAGETAVRAGGVKGYEAVLISRGRRVGRPRCWRRFAKCPSLGLAGRRTGGRLTGLFPSFGGESMRRLPGAVVHVRDTTVGDWCRARPRAGVSPTTKDSWGAVP